MNICTNKWYIISNTDFNNCQTRGKAEDRGVQTLTEIAIFFA